MATRFLAGSPSGPPRAASGDAARSDDGGGGDHDGMGPAIDARAGATFAAAIYKETPQGSEPSDREGLLEDAAPGGRAIAAPAGQGAELRSRLRPRLSPPRSALMA